AELSKVNMSGEVTMGKPNDGLTNHWIGPPGHHIYTTEITPQRNLPFDTTIHYATIHVHPFARGMKLRDLTTGTTIFRLNSQDWPDRVGVAYVEEIKSIEGIPIQLDQRYELLQDYDNTWDVQTVGMATPYLYFMAT